MQVFVDVAHIQGENVFVQVGIDLSQMTNCKEKETLIEIEVQGTNIVEDENEDDKCTQLGSLWRMIENKLNDAFVAGDDCREWFDKYSIYGKRKNKSSQILLLKSVNHFIHYFGECMTETSGTGPRIHLQLTIQVELCFFCLFCIFLVFVFVVLRKDNGKKTKNIF